CRSASPHAPICLMAAPSTLSRRISTRRAFSYSAGVTSVGADDAEADAVGVGVWRDFVAIRAAHHRDLFGDPRCAANHAQAAVRRTLRILRVALSVVVGAVPVAHPFPDVADD